MSKTVDYYDLNSRTYFESTKDADMQAFYAVFLPKIPIGGRILDAGCGSGRDLKHFREQGFQAEGIDASMELCKLAEEYSGCPVTCERIETYTPEKPFDGIWCCASLLHLPEEEIREFFLKCGDWLKGGGVLFGSMKSGIRTGEDEKGRYFTDFSEELLETLVKEAGNLSLEKTFCTEDTLGRDGFCWLSFLIRKTGK